MNQAYWDTEILTPIVDASFDISNLLPDSVVHQFADSSLEIVYQKGIYNFDVGNLFVIPDTSLRTTAAVPISYIFNPGQDIISNIQETAYQLPGVELKTFRVKSGKVSFKVSSRVREVTNFIYSIPCATLNGIPFSRLIVVPARIGNTPGSYSNEFDLSGYTIDLTGSAKNKVNTIFTNMKVSISSSAPDTVLVTPQDNVVIDNSFSDIVPSYAKGYLGQNTIEIPATQTDLSFFNRLSGKIKLETIKFNLALDNYIGVDARATIKSLKGINTNTNKTVSLTNPTPTININRASENGSTVIPSHANFSLTTDNSNINDLIEILPNKLEYQLKVLMNPLGNVSGSNDFIYTDNLLHGFIDLRVPLSFMANDLTLTSTVNFNISSGDNRNIKDGTLTVYANNGFPFDANIKIYTINDKNMITDTLVGTSTIVQAPVNSLLKVTQKRLTKITIPLNPSQINTLYDTKKAQFKIKFNTAAQPNYMKIYSDYTMDIKVVGDFNYTLQIQ
ncbi:MAG TPA: hypothetical protein PK289_04165 [Bacteroidia bacterium]|nr:hypothetical protein [Bacteroidia bacterium]HRG51857.1 hypothetical protein [Bacteroidia bacterium]